MKKNILSALALLFTLLVPGTASAQVSKPSILLGQDHKYGVHFRSNGEAIVTSRIVVTNRSDKEQKTIKVSIPGSIYELYTLQQILPTECRQYSTYSQDNYNQRTCINPEEPDYRQQYYDYYGQQVDYKQVNYTNNGNEYTFTLPTSISAGKSGSLIISYASKSYTQSKWGNTSFDFETFKVDERIANLSVSVSFDDDVYYNGKQSKVQYAPESSAGISSLAQGSTADSNKSLQNYIGNIGSSGVIVKKASNLAPGDTYHVKGSYATSWLALNWSKIAFVTMGLVVLTGCIYLITRKKRRKSSKLPPKSVASDISPKAIDDNKVVETEALAPRIEKTDRNYVKIFVFKVSPMFGSFVYALYSVLFSGVAVGIVVVLVSYVLQKNGGYRTSDLQTFVQILGMAAGALTLLISLFTLPVLLARRQGLRFLFITGAFQVLWLLIFILVISLFISSEPSPKYIDEPYMGPTLYDAQ